MTTTSDIAVPESLRRKAAERGWPEDLLKRAISLRFSRERLERALDDPNAKPEFFERRLYWHEQLTLGKLRGREATTGDNEAIIDLFANAPEEVGDWEIYTERGPFAFAQFRLQENVAVPVLEEDGRMIAICSFSMRKVFVGGQRLVVRYGQALRVHKDFRRKGYGDQVRSLPWGVGVARPSHTQYDIMRTENFAVVGWWEKYSPEFFKGIPKQEGEVPGVPVTASQFPGRLFEGSTRGIRKAEPRDVAACVRLINRTHRGLDLFRPHSVDFLTDALDEHIWGERLENWMPYPHVYGWDEYHVLQEGGRIVACAGLWDRGRDLRDRWVHTKTGDEKVISVTAVLDFGFEKGKEASMARLITYLIGETHRLGRDYLTVSLDHQPSLAKKLNKLEPQIDRRALRWGLREPEITRPYTDLRYW